MSAANVFRPTYRKLNEKEEELMSEIKNQAQALYTRIDQTPASREQSIAKTKLEEAVMWSIKGLTT